MHAHLSKNNVAAELEVTCPDVVLDHEKCDEVVHHQEIPVHPKQKLSAPKSRDSLRLRRRFLPLPEKLRDFLRPQDAGFPLRRKSLANRDFFCDEDR